MSIHGDARTGFAQSAEIGRCRTDRTDTGKDGVTMKDFVAGKKREDYFLDPKYRPYTENFFARFGLPMPMDDMVYRGNSQDLLFFDNLGFVVRTGPMNIVDMIHPGILQPLYWMPFDDISHVIAIYPGIRLPTKVINKTDLNTSFEDNRAALVSFMDGTNQLTKDAVSPHNFGYVDGNLVILDTEDHACGTKWKANKLHKEAAYKACEKENGPPHIAIRQVMVELYGKTPQFSEKIPAYDYHQPLRAQIDDALNEPDVGTRHEKLRAFYQSCRDAMNGTHPDVALYAPWTGNPDDNQSKRLQTLNNGPRPHGPA